MNLTEENNQPNSRPSVFGFSCPPAQWSQVPPQYMPWGHSPTSPAAPLVTFNAQPQQNSTMSIPSHVNFTQNNLGDPQPSTSSFGVKSFTHCKRKASLDISVPMKQHITEEKMAQHMSRLHISTENNTETNLPVEDSLARQKRLYVCEEMRRLQTESILPTSLLGRLERPCMAVMLWQPPAKIPSLLSNTSNLGAAVSVAGGGAPRNPLEEDENDNNAATADLNNMDMEA